MVRSTGAQIGLLAFGVAIVAGLTAGNSVVVVLQRALIAMILGAMVGQVAAWTAKYVLRDHLQRRKLQIDQEHVDAIRAMSHEAAEADEAEASPSGPVEV